MVARGELFPSSMCKEELLGMEVEKYPWVFDFRRSDYKSSEKKRVSWKTIARTLFKPDVRRNRAPVIANESGEMLATALHASAALVKGEVATAET